MYGICRGYMGNMGDRLGLCREYRGYIGVI